MNPEFAFMDFDGRPSEKCRLWAHGCLQGLQRALRQDLADKLRVTEDDDAALAALDSYGPKLRIVRYKLEQLQRPDGCEGCDASAEFCLRRVPDDIRRCARVRETLELIAECEPGQMQ